jgi:hypothetical protein
LVANLLLGHSFLKPDSEATAGGYGWIFLPFFFFAFALFVLAFAAAFDALVPNAKIILRQ